MQCNNQNAKALICELSSILIINDESFILQFHWDGPQPRAGQFFMIKPERTSVFLGRPIGIFEFDSKTGSVKFLIVTKGKGTKGPVRRHNFSRGPETHGSKYHRGVGALSAGTTPAEVPKGRRMAGRMGNEKITVQNLTIVRSDAEKNVILVKGAVPGNKGSVVVIKDSVKV